MARKAVAARRKVVSQLLVCDQGDVPDERKYEIRLSCQELHPGICAWVDRDIYASALKLAHNFEVYFDNDKLHKFACISDPSHDASSRQQSWYVYFTRRRVRRPHSQVTHVFVACVVHPDPGGTYVSLEQRSFDLWRFQTVWDIAKAARRSRYKQLSVQMMDSVPAGNGSFLLTCSCEDARILWPGVLKRHRPPVDGPPVDESAVRVRSKGKHEQLELHCICPQLLLKVCWAWRLMQRQTSARKVDSDPILPSKAAAKRKRIGILRTAMYPIGIQSGVLMVGSASQHSSTISKPAKQQNKNAKKTKSKEQN